MARSRNTSATPTSPLQNPISPLASQGTPPLTNDKLEIRVKKSEIFKNVLEGVALLTAALWAIFTFTVKDSPSLDDALNMSSDLRIDSLSKDSVIIHLQLTAENIGKSTFEGDSLEISYWTRSVSEVKKMKFFNVLASTNSKPDTTLKFQYTEANVIASYPPGTKGDEDFTFFMKKDKNKVIIYKLTFYAHDKFLWLIKRPISSTGTVWVAGIDKFNAIIEQDEKKDKDQKEVKKEDKN